MRTQKKFAYNGPLPNLRYFTGVITTIKEGNDISGHEGNGNYIFTFDDPYIEPVLCDLDEILEVNTNGKAPKEEKEEKETQTSNSSSG